MNSGWSISQNLLFSLNEWFSNKQFPSIQNLTLKEVNISGTSSVGINAFPSAFTHVLTLHHEQYIWNKTNILLWNDVTLSVLPRNLRIKKIMWLDRLDYLAHLLHLFHLSHLDYPVLLSHLTQSHWETIYLAYPPRLDHLVHWNHRTHLTHLVQSAHLANGAL